jgi:hypothetical protein
VCSSATTPITGRTALSARPRPYDLSPTAPYPPDLSVGGHHLGGNEVVHRQPVPVTKPTEPTAQGEPADTGVADRARSGGQPVFLRGRIHIAEQRTARHPDPASRGVDRHRSHQAEVDHQPVVTGGGTRRVVGPATHSDLQTLLAGEVHRGDHIGPVDASRDDSRSPVDVGVPQCPDRVVCGLLRAGDQFTVEDLAKGLEVR